MKPVMQKVFPGRGDCLRACIAQRRRFKVNFLEFAKSEIEKMGLFSEEGDFYGGMTGEVLMELCVVLARQRYSGMSTSLIGYLFQRLANGHPLSPLTGEESEWQEVEDGKYQNKRCPSVFKDGKTGQAYQVDRYIFVDGQGTAYITRDSRQYIESFPYEPETVVVRKDAGNV